MDPPVCRFDAWLFYQQRPHWRPQLAGSGDAMMAIGNEQSTRSFEQQHGCVLDAASTPILADPLDARGNHLFVRERRGDGRRVEGEHGHQRGML